MSLDIPKLVTGIHDYIGKVLAPIVGRLKALEENQTATLADAYRGVWQPNNKYARGSLTTHGGSLWLAMEDCEGKPGGSPTWRLIVKAGKDAS